MRAAVAAAVRLAPPHRPDAWRRRRPATKLDRDATLLGGFDRYRLAHLHLCARRRRQRTRGCVAMGTCMACGSDTPMIISREGMAAIAT